MSIPRCASDIVSMKRSSLPGPARLSGRSGCGRSRLALLVAGTLLALPRLAPAASGPEAKPGDAAEGGAVKQQCSDAFEHAQRLRNESHYVAANQEILKCANAGCGEVLFEECSKIYGELQNALPSVVFGARDDEGNELTNVQVTLNGQPFIEQLDGKPLPMDPGSQTFVFSAPGFLPAERVTVIRAGEHFRQVTVELEPKPSATNAKAAKGSPPAANLPPRARSLPVASYVLGGVGVLAMGSFVAFRLLGSAQYDQLERDCKPDCSTSQSDAVRQKYLISNVSLGLGSAALVGAVTVYLATPKASQATTAVQLVPSYDGVAARLTTRF